MVRFFVEEHLKVNADKRKVVVLNGEEGLECEVLVNWMCLEHVTEFKYWGHVLNESGTDEAECCRKVVSRRKVASARRSLGLWLYRWITSNY